jgi:uncharacterized protein (TIGR02246 family)
MPKHAMPLFAAAIAVALFAGCQQEPATEAGSTEATETGAAEEAATVDPAAVRQALDDFGDAWETTALTNDGAALAAIYAEDAVVLAPGTPIMSGRAEIESGFVEMMTAAPFTAIDIVTDGVEVSASGDLAYGYGTFTSTNTVDGQPYDDTGKWTSIHENRDGQWVTVLDIWNSNGPMGDSEEASAP